TTQRRPHRTVRPHRSCLWPYPLRRPAPLPLLRPLRRPHRRCRTCHRLCRPFYRRYPSCPLRRPPRRRPPTTPLPPTIPRRLHHYRPFPLALLCPRDPPAPAPAGPALRRRIPAPQRPALPGPTCL